MVKRPRTVGTKTESSAQRRVAIFASLSLLTGAVLGVCIAAFGMYMTVYTQHSSAADTTFLQHQIQWALWTSPSILLAPLFFGLMVRSWKELDNASHS